MHAAASKRLVPVLLAVLICVSSCDHPGTARSPAAPVELHYSCYDPPEVHASPYRPDGAPMTAEQLAEHRIACPIEEPVEGYWTQRRKVLALNLGVPLAIFTFGWFAWDWGTSSFQFEREGWLQADTGYGGADKLGHAFGSYALASLYMWLYEQWGYEPNDAALFGAMSSWFHMLLIEVGDGFSDNHGFSWEDLAFNTAGVLMAYVRQRSPYIRDSVDFRLEWIPTRQFLRGHRLDPFTDYSGQKYLLAFKLGGLLKSDNPWLRALEIHLGYFTRGYISGDEHRFRAESRYVYTGLGLNVTYLLQRATGSRARGIFDYIQVPYAYLPLEHRLSRRPY